MNRGFKVRALGEIAIRCDSLAEMVDFYENIIGLERIHGNANEGIVFFRIAEGFGGHTSVLALFHKTAGRPELHATGSVKPETGALSSLHHMALSLPFEEQEAAKRWFDTNGIEYQEQLFPWIGWRGIFASDPEGNTVELVAFDETILE
jgi:catechol 2,3-dioxygenase-like lactoylglutathione lyase family enzyme